MEINREALAASAGFFNGEGWVGLKKKNSSPVRNGKMYRTLAVEVGQASDDLEVPDVLLNFQQAVGFGEIVGPFFRAKKAKPYFSYRLSGFEKTQALMSLLWIWLSLAKRRQFKYAVTEWLTQPRLRSMQIEIEGCLRGHGKERIGFNDKRKWCKECNRLATMQRRSEEHASTAA